MPLISCHNGRLYSLDGSASPVRGKTFASGLAAVDALAPGGAFAYGAVHEILYEARQAAPTLFPLLLARAAAEKGAACANGGAIVWCDGPGSLYPPALAAAGIPLERLFLLRPADAAAGLWAVVEAMRCKGVSVTVAGLGRLTRLEARRLQLAVEQGGGAGLLLRPAALAAEHAALTRWLVGPAPAARTVQRWTIRLLHGHGGQVGRAVVLEYCRETNHVRAFEELAHRPPVALPAPGAFRRAL